MAHPNSPNVLIIGGGVIGLTIARELHKKGAQRITLVEKSVCGEESSWAAAGMLGPQAEADAGGAFFDMTLNSRDLYPEFAAELEDETGVNVELDRSGTLYLAFSDQDAQVLRQRYEWQNRAGLRVEYLSADEARRAEPFASPDVRDALFFPDDWQIDNRKLLTALRRYADLNEIGIHEKTEAKRLIVEDRAVAGIETETGELRSDHTILATGAWTSLIKLGDTAFPVKVEPVRGQIVAFQTAKRLFDHVIYSRGGYIVPRADGRILAGSTTEWVGFDDSTTESARDELRKMAVDIAPSLASLPVADQWGGLRPFAGDGFPVLGPIAGVDGLLMATAHYRNGILLAPLTAKIIGDKVVGGVMSKAFTTFGPDRFRFAAGSTK